jgi:polar amino acid transport system substrate-binding protein
VVPWFIKQEADVAAGVKQPLMMDMQTHKGLRMLPDAFMQNQQTIVIHQGRGAQALKRLQVFWDDYISEGRLARSMEEHQVTGASNAAPDQH